MLGEDGLRRLQNEALVLGADGYFDKRPVHQNAPKIEAPALPRVCRRQPSGVRRGPFFAILEIVFSPKNSSPAAP
jgi:hypothetical protein